MAIDTDSDLATIFASGDFDVAVTFDLTPTDLVIRGIFTDASDEVAMGGPMMIEAQQPTVKVRTSQLTSAVKPKVVVTVAGQSGSFLIERMEKTGFGVTVIYLSVV